MARATGSCPPMAQSYQGHRFSFLGCTSCARGSQKQLQSSDKGPTPQGQSTSTPPPSSPPQGPGGEQGRRPPPIVLGAAITCTDASPTNGLLHTVHFEAIRKPTGSTAFVNSQSPTFMHSGNNSPIALPAHPLSQIPPCSSASPLLPPYYQP